MFPIRLFSSRGRRRRAADQRSVEAMLAAAAAVASDMANLAESARTRGAQAEAWAPAMAATAAAAAAVAAAAAAVASCDMASYVRARRRGSVG